MTLRSSRVQVEDTPEAIDDLFRSRRWSDGLPIVPPTEARVVAMLGGARDDPERSLGRVPPLWAEATVEKVAVNAVMAGCRPAYLPVLLAAMEALCDPAFNLYSIQATTHPVAPLLIVSGPIVGAIGLNAGPGVFGPGWQANATIGRAIRLVLMNVGGAWPGDGDMATQGQPGKYSYCIAENQAANPWAPLHVDLGFDPAASAVTVFGGEAPHNVNDHVSKTAGGVLGVVGQSMATLGSNAKWIMQDASYVVALGPEHAATAALHGWTRQDVVSYLFDRARLPAGQVRAQFDRVAWAPWMHAVDDHHLVPVTAHPDNIRVFVCGGAGKHSSVIPSWGMTKSVTLPIEP